MQILPSNIDIKQRLDSIKLLPVSLQEQFSELAQMTCGIGANRLLFSICEDMVFHDDGKKELDFFKQKGGAFILREIGDDILMAYAPKPNKIMVSPTYLWKFLNESKDVEIARTFAHEVNHAFVTGKNIDAGASHIYDNLLDNKSAQLKHIGLEIAEMYSDAIKSYEASGKYWQSFEDEYPILAHEVKNSLKRFDLNPGNKIPKDECAVIANYCVLGFCVFEWGNSGKARDVSYKERFLSYMKEDKNYARGYKKESAKSFFRNADVPVTLSEKSLSMLMLITPDKKELIENDADLKGFVEYASPANFASVISELRECIDGIIAKKNSSSITIPHEINPGR